MNQFKGDGSFLSSFLVGPPQSTPDDQRPLTAPPATTSSSAVGPESDRPAWKLPDPSSDPRPATHDPGHDAPSTRRRRRFTETASSSKRNGEDATESAEGDSGSSRRIAKRRFAEDEAGSVAGSSRVSEDGRASENVVTPVADASAKQLEAVQHLNPLEFPDGRPGSAPKDTYEDCVESGGSIEGGTWEHKKRAREMIKTANLAAAITEASRQHKQSVGGAGIGGFLPPEIAAALENKASSSSSKSAGPVSEPSDPESAAPIGKANRGYQLLQKAGWDEQGGLGDKGAGITVPIAAVETKVLGQNLPAENEKPKDEFEQFRSRMMLAYKFRPNPLNNPRRSYDGYNTLYDNKKLHATLEKISSAAASKEGDKK